MAYYWSFENLIYSLERMRVLDVLLPFVLIFTIVFAILQKTKILGKDEKDRPRKNFNVVIALVMGLAVVIPHVMNPTTNDIVNTINSSIASVSLVLVAVIMILLVIGAFGKKMDIGESKVGGWFTILSIIIVVAIFLISADVFERTYFPSWLYFLYNPDFQALIVALIVFGLIIGWITKSDTEDDKKDKDTWIDQFKKTLK